MPNFSLYYLGMESVEGRMVSAQLGSLSCKDRTGKCLYNRISLHRANLSLAMDCELPGRMRMQWKAWLFTIVDAAVDNRD